jgi:LuxR family maltose regulon positive regulatory protein
VPTLGDLAATRLIPPPVPPGFVARPRLAARLDAAGTLTVLSGPAGSGKTVLLSEWASRQPPERVAWLSLESPDADPRRFWRAVAAALERAAIVSPMRASDSRRRLARDVAGALEARTDAITLVLDDVQEIDDSPALADLAQLLREPPPALRLVLATRRDPSALLGFAAALRNRELAFTLEETRALLERAGVSVRADVAQRLWERTAGWAAGLRLAALGMRGHPDPARFAAGFGGTDPAVAEYVLGEVLAPQPADVRAFLSEISILDRVGGELAAAVTGRDDAGRLLERLTREHVLAPDGEGWRRANPLVAELLRERLRPEQPAALHGRAARWLQARGHGVEALKHAVETDDTARAGELAEAHWVTLLVEGRSGSLRPLLDRSPADLSAGGPALALAVAAAYLDAGAVALGASWLEAAEAARACVPEERLGAYDLGLAALGVLRGRLDGDMAAALERAHQVLAHDESPGVDGLRALVLTEAGIAELWTGDRDQAERDLRAGCAGAQAAGCQWLRLIAMAHLVVHAILGGRYDDALRLADEAEDVARARGWRHTWPVGITAGARSAVALHREQIEEAQAQLERAVAALDGTADPPLRAMTLLQEAGVLMARGQLEEALVAIGGARRWLRDWPINPPMRELLVSFEATVRAALGDRSEGVDLLADADRSLEAAVAIARLAVEAGDGAAVVDVLQPHLASMGASVDYSRTEAWVLMALAHEARAHTIAASDAIERALAEASRSGLRRPFLVHGSGVAALLRRQQRVGTRYGELVEDLLAG